MDSLVDFYDEILNYTHKHNFSERENLFLDGQLIAPLKTFLLSLDREFNTDYFFERIKNLKRAYIKRNFTFEVRIVNDRNKAVKNTSIKISELSNSKSKEVIGTLKTDKYGFISMSIPEGIYEAEIEKYNLKKTCELHENSKIVFWKPKKKHWWQ
jgi:hypothetical protein